MPNDTCTWLSPQQLADRYRITLKTVYNWRNRCPHYGPPGIRVGKALRYRLTDVEAWEREQMKAQVPA